MTLPFVAMLPLKITGAHYEENIPRLRLLLDSFAVFLDMPERLRLHLVCVASEMAEIRAALPDTAGVELILIGEDELIPGIAAHRAIGWYKQQALKLAFAAICPTPFYLTLDPDVLLCRRLAPGHLVRDGRCFTSWMTKAEHPHWWLASSGLLRMPLDIGMQGLNVTPQMLARDVALRLADHLAARADPWLTLLDSDRSWTEYTLYSIFAEQSGVMERWHRTDLPDGRRLLGRSVWTPANFANYSLRAIHDDPAGAFFTVCASHANVSAATMRDLFEEMLFHADELATT